MRVSYRWVSVACAFAVAAVGVSGVSGARAAAKGQMASPCTGVVGVATWSPDGERIALVANGPDRSSAIGVSDTAGRHAHPLRRVNCPRRGDCRLINTPEDLYWARPGRLIYSDATKGLFAVPVSGKPRRFGASTDAYGTLSMGRRGDRVAYGSAAGPGEEVPITILSVPSGKVVGKIGGPKTDNVFPSLSPDGKRVVFQQATDTGLRVLVAAVDGATGDRFAMRRRASWSPTGDKIACLGTGSMSSALLLVSLRTGTATTSLPPVGPSVGVRWGASSVGRRTANTSRSSTDVAAADFAVVDLRSHKLRQLLIGAALPTDVNWSPNSRQLLVTEPPHSVATVTGSGASKPSGGRTARLRGCS